MADIDVSYITEALNGKIDMPNGASQGSVDFVVAYKTQTESDPSWYRVYKSGWVEQGGELVTVSSNYNTENVVLKLKMLLTSYYVSVQTTYLNNDQYATTVYAKTVNGFSVGHFRSSATLKPTWQVKGQIDPVELQRILGGN